MEKAEVLKRYKNLIHSGEKYLKELRKFTLEVPPSAIGDNRLDDEFQSAFEQADELQNELDDYSINPY